MFMLRSRTITEQLRTGEAPRCDAGHFDLHLPTHPTTSSCAAAALGPPPPPALQNPRDEVWTQQLGGRKPVAFHISWKSFKISPDLEWSQAQLIYIIYICLCLHFLIIRLTNGAETFPRRLLPGHPACNILQPTLINNFSNSWYWPIIL